MMILVDKNRVEQEASGKLLIIQNHHNRNISPIKYYEYHNIFIFNTHNKHPTAILFEQLKVHKQDKDLSRFK